MTFELAKMESDVLLEFLRTDEVYKEREKNVHRGTLFIIVQKLMTHKNRTERK